MRLAQGAGIRLVLYIKRSADKGKLQSQDGIDLVKGIAEKVKGVKSVDTSALPVGATLVAIPAKPLIADARLLRRRDHQVEAD